MELPKAGDLLVEKYLLEGVLGEGGMGVVFAAQHAILGKRVAVKLLLPEVVKQGDAVARFLNEARAISRIENEHVARVLDVGTLDNGLPYMVFEYLDGADLSEVLKERGPLAVADVADYLLQTIEAVAHAHALGIVHRDLKPANLFLARRPDGTARVKVLDFGISKALGGDAASSVSITKTSSMLGSPLYMSPEQLLDSKSVDHRCDIWALGVVAYQLLTDRTPFFGDNAVALFAAIHSLEPKSLRSVREEIAPAFDAAVLKCLRRNPEDRFGSVTELGACLVPFGTAAALTAFTNAKRILPLDGPGAGSASNRPPSPSFRPMPMRSLAPSSPGPEWTATSDAAFGSTLPADSPIFGGAAPPPADATTRSTSAAPSAAPEPTRAAEPTPEPTRAPEPTPEPRRAPESEIAPEDAPARPARSKLPMVVGLAAGLALLAGLVVLARPKPTQAGAERETVTSRLVASGAPSAVADSAPTSAASTPQAATSASALALSPDAAVPAVTASAVAAATAAKAPASAAALAASSQPAASGQASTPVPTPATSKPATPAASGRPNCNPPHDFDPACLLP